MTPAEVDSLRATLPPTVAAHFLMHPEDGPALMLCAFPSFGAIADDFIPSWCTPYHTPAWVDSLPTTTRGPTDYILTSSVVQRVDAPWVGVPPCSLWNATPAPLRLATNSAGVLVVVVTIPGTSAIESSMGVRSTPLDIIIPPGAIYTDPVRLSHYADRGRFYQLQRGVRIDGAPSPLSY